MSVRKAKPFRLFDAVLACVCVILVVEAAAPSAAIGNSKYFWWLLSIAAFFLPYGLVTAELGTAYAGGGGLYDWIARAFGRKWGGRAAFYYWIHFAIWLAALGVLFTEILNQAFGLNIGTWAALSIQLVYIWAVGILSLMPISESKVIINICSVFKVAIMAALGVLGVLFALTNGIAVSSIESARDFLPGIVGISFIAMVMFNFKGFEVVTSFAGEMKNPQKEIPKALFMAGVLIAAFYLFASFGIAVAIPRDYLSTSGGLLDSFQFFIDSMGLPAIIIPIIAIMFLYSLLANPVVWALGVNYVAFHAAENSAMPGIFAKTTMRKAPLGATVASSAVASAMVLIAPFIPDPDIFWGFFALQILMLLIPYVIMFPAFKKLRRIDPDTPRPYKAPGGELVLNLMTYSPMVMLLVSGILVAVYPNYDGSWTFEPLMIIGAMVSLLIGEVVVYVSGRRQKAAP